MPKLCLIKNKRVGFLNEVKKALGLEGLEALQNFIKECHLPTTLPELKSKVEITNDLLKKVADTTNLIKTNPRTLTKEEVYDILLECM